MSKEKMEEYFNYGIFIIAMIFSLVAIVSLYSAFDRLIGIWLDYKYMPIFQIAFNLSILITSVYLIRERLIKR